MNRNERELERANYDNWKLSNRDDENIKAKRYSTGYEDDEYDYPKSIGVCRCCEYKVMEDTLYVEDENDEDIVYHFSCYNHMRAEEEEEVNGD